MKIIKFLLVLVLLVSCKRNNEFEVKTSKMTNGWGYTITLDNKIIIKQTVIPTVSKQEGFQSEEDALKVGTLVLNRIKQKLPPTIARKDLILLKIPL